MGVSKTNPGTPTFALYDEPVIPKVGQKTFVSRPTRLNIKGLWRLQVNTLPIVLTQYSVNV